MRLFDKFKRSDPEKAASQEIIEQEFPDWVSGIQALLQENPPARIKSNGKQMVLNFLAELHDPVFLKSSQFEKSGKEPNVYSYVLKLKVLALMAAIKKKELMKTMITKYKDVLPYLSQFIAKVDGQEIIPWKMFFGAQNFPKSKDKAVNEKRIALSLIFIPVDRPIREVIGERFGTEGFLFNSGESSFNLDGFSYSYWDTIKVLANNESHVPVERRYQIFYAYRETLIDSNKPKAESDSAEDWDVNLGLNLQGI